MENSINFEEIKINGKNALKLFRDQKNTYLDLQEIIPTNLNNFTINFNLIENLFSSIVIAMKKNTTRQ